MSQKGRSLDSYVETSHDKDIWFFRRAGPGAGRGLSTTGVKLLFQSFCFWGGLKTDTVSDGVFYPLATQPAPGTGRSDRSHILREILSNHNIAKFSRY
jgi:hypothetical protein